ncbi:MAG: hypothetical protein HYS25_11700 [Ignavibacteriales bacterium]|nr:hypothetical protein [Ignavibacteriales bacterium]
MEEIIKKMSGFSHWDGKAKPQLIKLIQAKAEGNFAIFKKILLPNED